MSTRTSPWPAGVPCWADLATPEPDAAVAFYGRVMGWEATDQGEEFGGYRILHRAGTEAAGLGPLQAGQPPVWTLYLASDDVDATVRQAQEAGGSVLAPAFDVGDAGRMAVLADPAGAAFGVWQAGRHVGASLVNEPGGLVWEDLRSSDPDASRAFYARVFGHRHEPMEGMPEYHLFSVEGDDGGPVGGTGGLEGAPPGVPSHWLVYFQVEDADAATAAAREHGGGAHSEPFDTPFGRMAPLHDPWGATFMVMASVPGAPEPTDRSG